MFWGGDGVKDESKESEMVWGVCQSWGDKQLSCKVSSLTMNYLRFPLGTSFKLKLKWPYLSKKEVEFCS